MPCGFLKLAEEGYRTVEMLKGMGILSTSNRLHAPSLKIANGAAYAVSDRECKLPTFDMKKIFVTFMTVYLRERPQDGGLIDLIMLEAGPGTGRQDD